MRAVQFELIDLKTNNHLRDTNKDFDWKTCKLNRVFFIENPSEQLSQNKRMRL